MLVYGLISPHPPIILPEVGGEELKNVQQTITALDHAVARLKQARPEKLVIISPHEDHGFKVPEYYLHKQLPTDLSMQEILVTEPSYEYYYQSGQKIGAEARSKPERYAIIASGDLSHVLKADGPYGYNAAGPVLDELIVKAVRDRDAQALLAIDPATLDKGAECGLRSILFLLGALDGMEVKTEVLSYEGPFGVGYMVATFAPENPSAPDLNLTDLARKSIAYYLETGKSLDIPPQLPAGLQRQAGAFVSLHEKSGELRGCIGTIAPTKATLAEEVITNAVSAATHDPRFSPLKASELPDLDISVDVLTPAVPETDLAKLNPKTYGIIVTAQDGRQGVLLPDLEGVDTPAEQIRICREKGNIGPDEPVEIRKFEVERYL